MRHVFKVIRSKRSDIEMWQIFYLYSEKKSENHVGTRNYCSLSGNQDARILTATLEIAV